MYQKWVLNRLLEKYERSKIFAGVSQKQKIAIRLSDEKKLSLSMELIDEKRNFHESLAKLKHYGLIDYEWERYEEGNLIKRFWLTAETQAQFERAYKIAQRQSLRNQLQQCAMEISQQQIKQEWIRDFLQEMLLEIETKHRLPRFFKDEWSDLLKAFSGLDEIEGEVLERVFSVQIYGDSKWFERKVKKRLLSILKHVQKELTEEELWQWVGLVRYPEVMEFRGALTVLLKDEVTIDYSHHFYGAYINSYLVNDICQVKLTTIKKILFIENKTNYMHYITRYQRPEELVIYHGGVFSPMKRRWFEKIYEATHEATFYHWSDIDVGGFTIFCRLRDVIIPELNPYLMNEKVLYTYQNKGIPIENEMYYKRLQGLLADNRYYIFHDLITQMLKLRIRLEQEVMI